MKLQLGGLAATVALLALNACTGDDNVVSGAPDGSVDASLTPDSSTQDHVAPPEDAGADARDAGDSGSLPDGAGGDDASDASCPTGWLELPADDPFVLDAGVSVILHAGGSGTQDYACLPTTDGGYGWTLTGPDASLGDCNGVVIGHHFASAGGAGYPEWQTLDGTYVIGHKVTGTTPDGGAGSVAWLVLQAVDAGGGTGTLKNVQYIERLHTNGGLAPSTGCDSVSAEAGATTTVGYTADYYFLGP
jgi:hypothetical protein